MAKRTRARTPNANGNPDDGEAVLKTTLKGFFKAQIQRLALLTGFSTQKALSQRCIRFLMFHEVGDSGYPLAVFEDGLNYLRCHFAVVSVDEAVSRLRDHRVVGDEVVLTFDDGLASHATSVYPILERLRVCATFFVCPGLVEKREGIWTLETRALLAGMPLAQAKAWQREVGAPEGEDPDKTLDWMKKLPTATRREASARLRHVAGREAVERRRGPLRPLMSWDQLRQLDPGIVRIGSHSLSHSILPLLDDAELEREVGDSQRLLRERLGRDGHIFCYPDGVYDERVVNVTRRHYEAALTTAEGVSRPGDDLHALPRIPAGPSLPLFAWRLHRPTA